MSNEPENQEVKRWTSKRKSALVLQILQGSTSINEAAREHGLLASELEDWVQDAKAGMENALRAKPKDIHEQYEAKLKDMTSAYGEAMLENKALKKLQALLDETKRSS